MKEHYKKRYFYIGTFALLILFIAFAIFIAQRDFSLFEKQRSNSVSSENKIESWMNIDFITKEFNISKETIIEALNLSNEKINPEASLYRLCNQYKKNCTQIINELNEIK
jgi:hypothetical protein